MKRQKKRIVQFRQWSRKPFAIFNSLKAVIKICVLSVTYSLASPAHQASAQTDTTKVLKAVDIQEVEVSGQRAPVVATELSRIVNVISKKEIEQAPIQSINDYFRYIPQVDVRERGINGVQADISIQGGSNAETLILLNGMNLSDPQTEHYSLNLPLDLDAIDRIEILKGPASRIYGTNAFSGAINFITGEDPQNYTKESVTYGEFNYYHASLSCNHIDGNYHNYISASATGTDGYMFNTAFQCQNAFYNGKLLMKEGYIGLQAGAIFKDFGANSFYSPEYLDQHDNTQTYFAGINAKLGEIIKFTPELYWRRNYDHYILIDTDPTYYQNFHYTDAIGGGLNLTYREAFGKTALGFDVRKEIIYSNSLGVQNPNPIPVPGQDSIFYDKTAARTNLSIYLEQDIHLGRFNASGGIMLNNNTSYTGIQWFPGLDISYMVLENLKIYGTLNRSLRLPTYTDLYYNGPNESGNPELKPETAWTTETGFKYSSNGLQGNISYFHRNAQNIIDWISTNGSPNYIASNFSKIITDGLEFNLNINTSAVVKQSLFIQEVFVTFSLLHENKDTAHNIVSSYVLDYLKDKITAGITLGPNDKFGLALHVTWQSRNSDYQSYSMSTNTYSQVAYVPFSLIDAKIFYKFSSVKLFAETTNLANTKYSDYGSIQQPGRWIKAGLEVTLGQN